MSKEQDQKDIKKLIMSLRGETGAVDISDVRLDTGLSTKRIKNLVMTYPKVLRKYTKKWWEYSAPAYSKNIMGDKRTPASRFPATLFSVDKNPYPVEENVEEIVNSWKNYINEDFEGSYEQEIFDVFFQVRILKNAGGNKSQTQNEIRSIPNVTTVSSEGGFSEFDDSFVGTFHIRFALETPEEKNKYIEQTLKPGLRKIKGLSIIKMKGLEKIK